MVSTIDVPLDVVLDLNLFVNIVAEDSGGQVHSATLTTWQGFDAIEAVVSMPDVDAIDHMLLVRTPQRMYLLQQIGVDGSPQEYEKFKASFEITL
jgi:hypothetical protein